MEKSLNKDQFQSILDTRPNGVSVDQAVDMYIKNGWKIEGINDKPISPASHLPEAKPFNWQDPQSYKEVGKSYIKNTAGFAQDLGAGTLDVIGLDNLSGGPKISDATQAKPGYETADFLGAGATIAGPGIERAPSLLKGFLNNEAVNAAKNVGKSIVSRFQKAVKPSVAGQKTLGQVQNSEDNILSAVKTIKENAPNLRFSDDVEGEIVGQTPKNLKQLTESVDQTKKTIFQKYDTLAKQAGQQGVAVDLAPIASELDQVIGSKALQLTNPKAVAYAQDMKDRYLKAGALDAETAQQVIENYNKSLQAFYRNPSYDTASQVGIDSLIANNLRKKLDEGISGATGEEYQALKSQYGALKSIENDVVKAQLRDAKKNPAGLIDYTDIFSGGQLAAGLLSLNPGLVASGIAQKGIQALIKRMNDPNRAVEKLFKDAEKLPQSFNAGAVPKTAEKVNPLLEEAKKYKSADEFVNKEYHLVKDANIDPKTIKLSGDASEKTAKERAKSMVPIQELDKPVTLKINADGTYQVVDGNARVTAHIDQNVPITKYVLDTKYSDKQQLTDLYNQATKASPDNSLLNEARKYKSAEEFENAVKKKASKAFELQGDSIKEISIIGSTANGKLNPNDLDILITPTKKRGPTTSENIHNRKEFNEIVQNEIESLFPGKKVHVTVSEYDATRGKKMSLTDLYNQAKGNPKGMIDLKTLIKTGAGSAGGFAGAGLISKSGALEGKETYNAESTPKLSTDKILKAISYNETRGEKEPYSFSRYSGTSTQGDALGKYQITEGELKTYGKRYLGDIPSKQEFLSSPKLQEEYMKNKINYLIEDGYSLEEILASHRGGVGNPAEKVKKYKKYVEDALKVYASEDTPTE